MARRRLTLLLALTLGFIAVPGVSGGGTGLDDPPAAAEPIDAARIDEPGAHLHVPISTPRCVACERVARGVVRAVAVLDGFDDDDDAELTEAENARRASRRRRGFHGRSEAAIEHALTTVCESHFGGSEVVVTDDDGDVVDERKHCEVLLGRHGESIADHVFADGHLGLRDFLCVRLERVCPKVVDAGARHDEL